MSASALARAKVNLSLHVLGRRDDGRHDLDSLVVFPNMGDLIEVEPASGLSLSLDGPFGFELDAGPQNLVFAGAEALRARLRRQAGASIRLEKRLPIASGVGGGSADAAAALKLLNALWAPGLAPDDLARLGFELGADVPVCLAGPAPARMRGVGERVSPAPRAPNCWMVLANPNVKVETAAVFAALERRENAPPPEPPARFDDVRALVDWLRATRNDLEPAAEAVAPAIADVRAAITAQRGCAFSRMSGSGATCYGLFEDGAAALDASAILSKSQPGWWAAAAAL